MNKKSRNGFSAFLAENKTAILLIVLPVLTFMLGLIAPSPFRLHIGSGLPAIQKTDRRTLIGIFGRGQNGESSADMTKVR